MVPVKYKDSYKEVYVILGYLEESEYNKIPLKVINAIKENMNENYQYEMNRDIDLFKQPMLIETKATLFNLFRDYLATPEQKEKIIKMQKEDREKLEQKKQMIYNSNLIFKNRTKKPIDSLKGYNSNNNTENVFLIKYKKKSMFHKILDRIRYLINR